MSFSPTEVRDARAQAVDVQEDTIRLDLVDGRHDDGPALWYPRLWYGTTEERAHFELLDEGRYIHWPDLDEDLSIDGMVAGRRSGENAESLRKWLAARDNGRG